MTLDALLTAADRPKWLCSELLATSNGESRLQEWVDGGGLDRSPLSAETMRQRLVFLGDDALFRLVVEALQRIAPPVVDSVLSSAWVIGIGCSSSGLCARRPPQPDKCNTVIAFSCVANDSFEDVASIFAHECAHLWLHESLGSPAELRIGDGKSHTERFLSLAAKWDLLDVVITSREQQERQAAALACAWGFNGAAADESICATATGNYLRTEALVVTSAPRRHL